MIPVFVTLVQKTLFQINDVEMYIRFTCKNGNPLLITLLLFIFIDQIFIH